MELESLIETLRQLNMELADLENTLAAIAGEKEPDVFKKDEVITGVTNG